MSNSGGDTDLAVGEPQHLRSPKDPGNDSAGADNDTLTAAHPIIVMDDDESKVAESSVAGATDDDASTTKLTRKNSVRARANMFQALEERLQQNQKTDDPNGTPIRKCKF